MLELKAAGAPISCGVSELARLGLPDGARTRLGRASAGLA